jgi:Ca2+-binding RTX toxin-like protein
MARFRAHFSVDMTDLRSSIGRTIYADEDVLVVRDGREDTYYFGNFSYPGGEWKGTIERVFFYYDDIEWGSITGLDLSTRYATVGASREAAYRRALADDDVLLGSAYADGLVGYAGDDRMNGGSGDDLLVGGRGDDRIAGGGGSDDLRGQAGRDALAGGRGDDRLAAGDGADLFVFGGDDGTDQILDFRNRLDKIAIDDGARRFGQLEIEKDGDDVVVAFDDTQIVVRDVSLRSIGAEDFVF